MDKRKEVLNTYYNENCDEDSRLISKHGSVEFLTTTHYIDKYLKPGDKILEVGAGTGAYSIHYAKKGYDVTALDFVKHNLEVLKTKITPDMNIKAVQGDALDLSRYEDNTYDVTLVLGPLYHLYEEKDINKAIDEAIRVTKKDGIIMIAYLTSDSIMLCWTLKDHHFDRKGISFDENYKMYNHVDEIFSAFYVDEFDDIMKNKDVKKLHMVASDGMSHHMKELIDSLDDYEFSEWMKYHLSTCERKDLQGYSNHMLYIGRKI